MACYKIMLLTSPVMKANISFFECREHAIQKLASLWRSLRCTQMAMSPLQKIRFDHPNNKDKDNINISESECLSSK